MSAVKEKSVLILDDSRAMREMLKVHLTNLGVTDILPLERVPEAIRAVKARTFGIILCDYNLGGGRNGQQFLEELRTAKLISHSDVFVMVTAERQYENVMSVAEYAPDDYLLKPFSSNELDKRLLAAIDKKYELRGILRPIDKGNYSEAVAACDRRIESWNAKYRPYVERIRAETYFILEEYEKSVRCYEDILVNDTPPWAELWLAKALLRLWETGRAKGLIEHVIKNNPVYLESHDSLAHLYETEGDDASAQTALMKAVEQSPLRLDRQWRLGEIALRNNDTETAEKAYSTIVSAWPGSCLHSPEAYLRLAEIAITKGDEKKAQSVLASLEKSFDKNPSADFCLAIARIDMERKRGDAKKAEEHFRYALGIAKSGQKESLPKHSILRFAVECLSFNEDESWERFLRDVCENSNRRDALKQTALWHASDGPTKVKVRAIFEDIEQEMLNMHESGLALARSWDWEWAVRTCSDAAARLSGNPEAQFTAAQVLLAYIEKHGWDENSFLTVRRFIEKATRLAPNHPRSSMMRLMVERVKKKFGIRSEPVRTSYDPKKQDESLGTERESGGKERGQPGITGNFEVPGLDEFVLK